MNITNVNLESLNKAQIKQNYNFKAESQNSERNYTSYPFVSPCDAKYLIKKNGITFKGQYSLKKLPSDELEKLKADLQSRFKEIGLPHIEFSKHWEANFAIQAVHKLLNHKIFDCESVVNELDSILTHLIVSPSEKANSEAILEFADYITSEPIEKIYKDSDVQKNMGSIFYMLSHYDIDVKKDFIEYLLANPGILEKSKRLGLLIQRVNENNYQDIVDNIDNPYFNLPKSKIFSKFLRGSIPEKIEEKPVITKKVEQVNDGKPKGFARIGGQTKAIETIQKKFIFPKKFPELFQGVQPEKGAILYGPPGTGKSLLAKALSEESDSYFVKMGASDMSQKWVGSTEENWRNLFEDLKAHQPAILFVDEADALCKKRGGNDVHGDKELNQFLKLMSDLNLDNVDVFVLMATNKLESFDEAVLRDGRFGTHIEMLPPQNVKEVEEIFNIHANGLKLDKNVAEDKSIIFKKMLELKLTGSGIEGVLKNSHDEALNRLGLFEKMKTNTVTPEDVANFSIKCEDILASLEKRTPTKKRSIGF